ncbi:MAG: peptidase M16 [Ignavibacteriae bacterium]|nr:peptidase M16 [Ignavibacteriota bacterium]
MNRIEITELSNGIRIVSENIPYVKSFSLGFWFDVGSRDEIQKNNGISHFLEHMFFKGTEKRSAKRLSDDIESLGGYLNAFTSKEQTCFYGRGLEPHLEKTFSVLSDMIQNSVFKENEVKKEAQVVIDELYDIEDSPEELIFDKFETSIFSGNSLSYPIIGTEKNLQNFKRNDLIEFVKSNYGFNNFYIVASGAIDHKKLLKLADKYITKDLGITKKKRDTFKKETIKNSFVYKEIQQAHLIMGRTTYGYNSKRRTELSVLGQILGEGSSSRLFQSVRERNGIAYQINSFLNSFYDVSTFGIYYSTNDKNVEKAQNLILNELTKLKNKKVSDRELKRAKEYLKGSILMSLESTTNRMLRIAQSYIYFNKIKSVEETIEEINSVTKEKILELSNELFDESKFSKSIISSKNLLLHSAA